MSGESLTFYSLFNRVDRIEIPILQRDYAQGRPEESEVRSLFLRSLFNALTKCDTPTRQPLDLDFVYGNYESSATRVGGEKATSKVFSVLDGQQRLTTLFLLHWYLALANGSLNQFRQQFVSASGQSRFTYKTRPGTNEFFNALVVNDLTIADVPISETIADCQWFYLSWHQDPTVRACLYMLNAIQKSFAGSEKGLFERLADGDRPYITFQFLDLHSFGLSDELYIKMNARGKPLTIFENFKAKLEQYISSYTGPWPEYHLSFRKDMVDGYEYFIHKIDTDWADLFWPYRTINAEDNTFDDEFMNFFRLTIMFHSLLDSKEQPDKLARLTQALFGVAGRLKELSLSKYDELGCFSQALIIRFIQIVDLIYGNGLSGKNIRSYLDTNVYYAEEDVFKRIVSNSANYDDKLRFFAFYSNLAKSDDLAELNNRMRVIYNLVENTITDSPMDFYRALFVIHDLSQIEKPILEALKDDFQLSVFLSAQILEEKIKAHLILKSDRWHQAIVRAESHAFFNGQIGSVLNFSGVLTFYRQQSHCNWSEGEDSQYFCQFIRYFNALSAVFNKIAHSSAAIDYAWERAVLSKGVYCTRASSNRLNLLHSRDTRNNIPRDHSWRRRLRIGIESEEAKQAYVKAVLDDSLFNSEDLQNSLEAICCQALKDGLDDWRHSLVKHKSLYEYCTQGFIVQDAYGTVLLRQSQRNHYHCELFAKVLELELNSMKDQLQPFTQVYCESVKSRDDNSEVRVTGCVLDDRRYQVVVRNIRTNFSIFFKTVGQYDYPDSVVSMLERLGMSKVDAGEGFGVFYQIEQSSIEQSQIQILRLCSALRELTA